MFGLTSVLKVILSDKKKRKIVQTTIMRLLKMTCNMKGKCILLLFRLILKVFFIFRKINTYSDIIPFSGLYTQSRNGSVVAVTLGFG